MKNSIRFLAVSLCLLLVACSTSELRPLAVDGSKLHPPLATYRLGDGPVRHVPRGVLRENPQHSTDPEFITAVARSGSQGRLGGEGIRSALYALYEGDRPVGIYGLEAVSKAEADRLEARCTRSGRTT